MARPKGAKNIFPIVTKKQLEMWPDASQFVFDDWVFELLACQPQEEEKEVFKELPRREGPGAPGNPIKIDGVIYANAFQAAKILHKSNSLIHKWLREGKAIRV